MEFQKENPGGICNGIPGGMSERVSDGISAGFPCENPRGISGGISVGIP